jgi:hypothetical protein
LKPEDYMPAEQRIYAKSHLVLPIAQQ